MILIIIREFPRTTDGVNDHIHHFFIMNKQGFRNNWDECRWYIRKDSYTMFIFFHANVSLLTQIPLQYIIYHYWYMYYRIIRFDGDSISKHFKGNGTPNSRTCNTLNTFTNFGIYENLSSKILKNSNQLEN